VTRQVVFSPEAQMDVRVLYVFIAERSGDARAIAYLNRIETYCLGFADFPVSQCLT
jgi:toxin ParE1/3/4